MSILKTRGLERRRGRLQTDIGSSDPGCYQFVSDSGESAFRLLQATGTLWLQYFALGPIIPRDFEDFQGMSTLRVRIVLFLRRKLDRVGTYDPRVLSQVTSELYFSTDAFPPFL